MQATLPILLIFILTFTVKPKESAEYELSIKLDSGQLAGTYYAINPKPEKVVLIIPGSGPTDRNGNSAYGLENNSLKMIADELALAGIPSLRVDKRGTAGSQSALTSEGSLTFDRFVDDMGLWVKLLTDSLQFRSVVVIGHSQGSLVGMLTAFKNEEVSGLISIAGPGESIDATLIRQIKTQAPVLSDETEAILDSLRMGSTVKNVNPLLQSIFRPSVQPFLISYMQYNPTAEIARMGIPVLVINGTTDIQVSTTDAEALHQAAKNSQLLIIDEMNHVLKSAPEDRAENLATYNNPSLPLADGLMDGITQFIQNL